jgi:hypothetical protein
MFPIVEHDRELAARHRPHLSAGEESGDAKVVAWLEAEPDGVNTSAVVVAQLAYWCERKKADSGGHCKRG